VHAHTGVKTHLIGPGDLRMVARVVSGVPSQSGCMGEGRVVCWREEECST
jgi:hypothetical protein